MEHRAFQLDPELSTASQDKISYLLGRLRAPKTALDEMIESCRAMFAAAGLPTLKRDGLTGNTFDSHRLLAYARTLPDPLETQARCLHALFSQYFHHGCSMSDHDVLLAAAAEAGIDVAGARMMLSTDAQAATVCDQIAAARAEGVTAVPHFRIGGRPVFGGGDSDFLAIFAEMARA